MVALSRFIFGSLSILLCATFAIAQSGRRQTPASRQIIAPVETPERIRSDDARIVVRNDGSCLCAAPDASRENLTATTTESLNNDAVMAEQVFTASEVTTRAVITARPLPSYTEEARISGTAGRVVLRIVLSSIGRVTVIRVVEALPDGLTENAIAAACRIRFTPAMREGRAVAQYVTVEYGFQSDRPPFGIAPRRSLPPRP